jgi:hypothetical protein
MIRRTLSTLAYLVTFLAFVATTTHAQSMSDRLKDCEARTKTYSNWVDCVTETVVKMVSLETNQRHPSKQVELPSLAENSTSLVDQTAAPDLAGLALNFAGVKSKEVSDDNGASGTITTSAYALYALATRNDPLDPTFYNAHPDLRRFSFTIGSDGGEEDSTTHGPATVAGFKLLIVNGRELAKNRRKLDAIAQALGPAGPVFATISNDITNYLALKLGPTLNNCNQVPPPGTPAVQFSVTCLSNTEVATTVARLTAKQREEIAEIVARQAMPASPLIQLNQTTAEVVGTIRRAPQLSFTFQSKLRDNNGNDEYRTGLLFDYGVWDRFNVSLNGTFDYDDSKIIGGDTRAGRLAAEGIFQLTPNKSVFGDPRPWLLSTSAEAKWANNSKSTYTGQLKLTIPIPGMTGVNFPISLSVANRSDLIEERVVRGRFGFTIDITKLLMNAP